MKAKIINVENDVDGKFGVMLLEGKAFCVTLMLPSGIPYKYFPDGDYICERYQSPRHGEVWLLKDVPNFTYIEIHAGNDIRDTRGCILVGQYFDKLRGNRAILNSGETLKKFMIVTKQADRLELSVITAS